MSFIFKITTTTSPQTFVIPCTNTGTFNATVDYGDGTGSQTVTAYNDSNLTHSFATAGQHTITIDGTFPSVRFHNNTVSRVLVDEVVDLGDVGWVNLYRAFRDCSNLTTFNLGTGNTSSVTNTHQMFYNCSSLTALNVSSFDTSSVTDMSSMFYNCSSLTALNVSSFDTSSATNISQMFRGCTSLTSLDVSNFNTSSVTNMSVMFFNCSSLTTLDLSNFDTSSVANMGLMFYLCSSLTTLNVSNFDTSSVANMSSMFTNCTNLTNLDIKHFNVSSVTVGTGFLQNANNALTTTAYDELLEAWAAQDVQPNVAWHFGNAKYTVETIVDWAANDNGKLSVVGNKLSLINGAAEAANTTTLVTLEIGKSYTLTLDFVKNTNDAIIAFNSSSSGGSGTRLSSLSLSSTGSYSVLYTATSTNVYVEFANNSTTINHNSKVDNISLKLT